MTVSLFLIPTTLANNIDHATLATPQLQRINHIKHFIVETPKTARQHLKFLKLMTPIQDLLIYELNKHNQNFDELISPLVNGHDLGLISDCGMPAIADPGSQIVKLCHTKGFNIVPFYGPSSILIALMASGFNGQYFTFNGYLPIEDSERIKKLKELQDLVIKNNQSQIIIEAPFRNSQLLTTIINTCSNKISLSIAIDLMTPNEQIISKNLHQWQQFQTLPELHKREVVFILGQ